MWTRKEMLLRKKKKSHEDHRPNLLWVPIHEIPFIYHSFTWTLETAWFYWFNLKPFPCTQFVAITSLITLWLCIQHVPSIVPSCPNLFASIWLDGQVGFIVCGQQLLLSEYIMCQFEKWPWRLEENLRIKCLYNVDFWRKNGLYRPENGKDTSKE